jgi:hypothetical protein
LSSESIEGRAEGERSAADRPSRAAAPYAVQLAAGLAEQREREPCAGRRSGTGGRGRRSGTRRGGACGAASEGEGRGLGLAMAARAGQRERGREDWYGAVNQYLFFFSQN